MKVGKQSITVDNVQTLRDVKQIRQSTVRTVANFDTSLSLNKKKVSCYLKQNFTLGTAIHLPLSRLTSSTFSV